MNMLDCEMKHKYVFVLHSLLPAAFGSETEQATKGNIILNWSWIHQKSSVWALVLDAVVTVSIHLRSDKANSHQFQLSRTGIYPLYCLEKLLTSYSIQYCFFHQQFLWIIENVPKNSLSKQIKIHGVFTLYWSSMACFLLSAQFPYGHLEQNNRQL